jgi:hypothetical protein
MVRAFDSLCVALLVTSSCAEECAGGKCPGLESNVLMQRLNRKGGQLPVRQATQAVPEKAGAVDLFQAAAKLFRTGASPDIIDFTNSTMEALETEILPNLLKGYDEDTALLTESFSRVEAVLEHYENSKASLQTLYTAETQAKEAHHKCRERERDACEQHNSCIESCTTYNQSYVTVETEYLAITETIKHHWCEVYGNRSDPVWRTSMTTRFQKYLTLGQERITAWEALEACETHCTTLNWANAGHEYAGGEGLLQVDSENPCNSLQHSMEQASCRAEAERDSVNDEFETEWQVATTAFEDLVAVVKPREEIRHRDFKALKGVKCLLKHIVTRAGAPCDEEDEPGVADQVIEDCETYWQIDVHLLLKPWNITYPEVPAKPEPVPAQPHPCTEEWISETLAGLTGECFSGIPACQACPEIPGLEEEAEVVEPFTGGEGLIEVVADASGEARRESAEADGKGKHHR